MRITVKRAEQFIEDGGKPMMVPNAVKYLELADGDCELAKLVAAYYLDGGKKDYTIGQVIRDYWLRKGHEESAGGV